MANTILTASIEVKPVFQDVIDRVRKEPGNQRMACIALADYFTRLAGGNVPGKLVTYFEDNDGTAAAQTIASVQTNADAGDTVTVCGVVFTVAASPSSEPSLGEFAAITDDDTMAAALNAAINAHPALTGLCTSGVSTDTCTVTMSMKGVLGNNGRLTTSDATAFTLGAATFAAGAVGTVRGQMRCYPGGLP
jgi:hypothetical protein